MNVKWIICDEGFPESSGVLDLDKTLDALGVEYFKSTYDRQTREFSRPPFVNTGEPVVIHGSVQFVNSQRDAGYLWQPGPYGIIKKCAYSYYTTYLPNEWFLNSEGYHFTFGRYLNIVKKEEETYKTYLTNTTQIPVISSSNPSLGFIKNNTTGWVGSPGPIGPVGNSNVSSSGSTGVSKSMIASLRYNMKPSGSYGMIFIRPDSGLKTFPGMVVKRTVEDLQKLQQLYNIDLEELIMVSDFVDQIRNEYRFFIVNREIVAMAHYLKDGEPVMNEVVTFIPNCAINKAKLVAEYPWQLDVAYTVDIAETNSKVKSDDPDYDGYMSECKIIELNSFCSSGFYGADKSKLVQAINSAAIAEFSGEI